MPIFAGRRRPLFGRPAALAALLVALLAALGPAAGAAPAGAAPTADSVKFSMEVDPRSSLLKPLCIGQSQPFYVSVIKTTQKSIGGKIFDYTAMVLGVTIAGAVDTPRVGTLTRTGDAYTGGGALSTFQTVTFVFKAKQTGQTTLRFTGKVNWHWLPGATGEAVQASPDGYAIPLDVPVTITVKACRVKASAVHRWSAGGAIILSTMEETLLSATDEGQYSGDGTLTWTAGVVVPDCITTDDFAPSPVALSGVMGDDGQLALALTYVPAVDSATILCESFGGITEDRSWTVLASPDPLNIQVSSFGGVATPAQVLVGEQSSTTGSAVIVVVPAPEDAPAVFTRRSFLGAALFDFLARLPVRFAPRPGGY